MFVLCRFLEQLGEQNEKIMKIVSMQGGGNATIANEYNKRQDRPYPLNKTLHFRHLIVLLALLHYF